MSYAMSIGSGISRLLPRSCKRRSRVLAPLAENALLARGDGRPFAPVVWAMFFGLAALFAQSADLGLLLIPSLGLFAGLCLISLFDACYFVIPDGPMMAVCFCAPFVWIPLGASEALWRIAAAAAGYAALRFVATAYQEIRGWAGIGDGDARLFAVAGLWLGFPGLAGCLVYAAFSALVSASISLRLGKLEDERQPLPFGPHLALGIWLSYVFGSLEFG